MYIVIIIIILGYYEIFIMKAKFILSKHMFLGYILENTDNSADLNYKLADVILYIASDYHKLCATEM